MKCEDIYGLIDELVARGSGELDPSVVEHIETCAACRVKMEQWKRIREFLKTSSPSLPPKDLNESILDAVEVNESEFQEGPPKESWVSTYWIEGALSLAAMILFGLGLWYFYLPRKAALPDPGVVSSSQVKSVLAVSLDMPAATSVHLVGDFNGWDTSQLPLEKDDSGRWKITLSMEPGYYQYQILVDGEKWLLDPNNKFVSEDGFGSFNSAVYL